jgi:excisionase family DNA binding protein
MRRIDPAAEKERPAEAHAASGPLTALLDVGDVAQILKVDRRYVYRLVSERRIPFVKCGHYLRFEPADIQTWLASARRGVTSRPAGVGPRRTRRARRLLSTGENAGPTSNA